jgi:hypothetical protein
MPATFLYTFFEVKMGRLMFSRKKLTFAQITVSTSKFNALEGDIIKQKNPIFSYQAYFAPPQRLELWTFKY